MKIAMLQSNVVTGDVAGNVERIVAAACDAAARGADLCVTPELALCGAGPGSFLRADDFAQGCRAGLDRLAEALR
ncbi:nitrilase-related carbon-nitrogen hydrolase, partial [uncultured Desulfovibrio sp.]|uniref:nitrilase-related carbon-nitrogen hydrolase n=1 Tax=uncultured Desulfovibrio sp. TaxID=167968 RepID=UPI002603211E